MKLTLTYCGRFTKKKDGTPLVGKSGRPYTSLRIKTVEYGDRYISGFDSAETRDWKEGDTVEANVEEKGEYLNFSVPKVEKGMGMSELERGMIKRAADEAYAARMSITLLIQRLERAGVLREAGATIPGTDMEYPEDYIDPTKIPF